MPAREDFNLDQVLGERYVRHYLRFINGAQREFYVDSDARRPWDYQATQVLPPRERAGPVSIERLGTGPDLCSSSYGLAVVPGWSWDVCGYYRRLGVPWHATRRQLRAGYLARGGGSSVRLTTALRMLLQPAIRRAYDLASPLVPFLPDPDTNEAIKRRAAREAARRTQRAAEPVAVQDVLDDWGLRQGAAQGDAVPPQPAEPGGQPLGATLDDWAARWSWYVMDEADRGPDPGDEIGWEALAEYMRAWQGALREALAERKIITRFAVGLCPGPGHRVWPLSDGASIVFLGRESAPPAAELARKAVREAFW